MKDRLLNIGRMVGFIIILAVFTLWHFMFDNSDELDHDY